MKSEIEHPKLLNGQEFVLHIVQYVVVVSFTRDVGLDVVGGIDVAVVEVTVFVVGADTTIKVGIAALDSKKDSSNCLTLYCFLLV